MSTIAERVARGAAWLDDVRPGWRDQVSLDAIDLNSNQRCVMGQVFAGESEKDGFTVGCEIKYRSLGDGVGIGDLGFNAVAPLGLDLMDPVRWARIRHQTAELEAEWRRVIHAPQPARVIA